MMWRFSSSRVNLIAFVTRFFIVSLQNSIKDK
jgi:hypothetical protein